MIKTKKDKTKKMPPKNEIASVIDAPAINLSGGSETLPLNAFELSGLEASYRDAPTLEYNPISADHHRSIDEPTVDMHARIPLPDPDGQYSHKNLVALNDEELNNVYKGLTEKIWAAEKYIANGEDPTARDFLNKAYQWQANAVLARREKGLIAQSSSSKPMSEIIDEFSRSAGVEPTITNEQLLKRRNLDPSIAPPHMSVTGGEKTELLKTDEVQSIYKSVQPLTERYPSVESDSVHKPTPEKRQSGANGLRSSIKTLSDEVNNRGIVDKYVPEVLKKRMRAVGNKVLTFAFAKSLELGARNHDVSERLFSKSGGEMELAQLSQAPPMPNIENMLSTKPTEPSKQSEDRISSNSRTQSVEQSNDRHSLIQDVAIRLGTSTDEVVNKLRKLAADPSHDVMLLDGPDDVSQMRVLFPGEAGLYFVNNPDTIASKLASV